MPSTDKKFRKALLPLALGFAITYPAFAQDAEEKTTTTTEEQELDVITVTGSRIKRAGLDTLEPAVSVSREQIDRRGITNVADSLNEIPGFGIGVTPEGGQAGFGAAVNFVNRFGLGSNRTLTTVNGRRFVSSNPVTIFGPAAPGLQVDLNSIPVQLIDRVDNISVGGAPVYGSDAIAGTVNVILRENYEGAEVGATYGLTDQGDGERVNLRGLWGTNFADGRGNFTVAANIDNQQGVLQTDRALFSQGIFYGTNPLASVLAASQPGRTPGNDGRANPSIPFNTSNTDGIPNAVLAFNRRIFQVTPGGLLFPSTGATTLDTAGTLRGFGTDSRTYLQFDRNGNLVTYNPGVSFGGTDASGGDGFSLIETGQVTSEVKRANLFSNGYFDFTDSVRGYYEALYFKSEGVELIDQPIYNATLFGGLSAPLTFSVTDPRLTDQARARLTELGVTSFRLSRASRDLVTNNAETETDLYRVVAGVSYDFDFLDQGMTWDTSINYGRSDADNFSDVLNQQNFVNAINVTRNAAGQIVCSGTGTIGVVAGSRSPIADPSCVPLNIFGEGRPDSAARDYVTDRTRANSKLTQTIFNTNVSGSLFEYYAGSIGFALGYETRKEEANFTPDPFQVQGLGRAVPILGNGGEFETDEFFAELLVPLISPEQEIPGLHSFDVELKGRRVDNTVNGAFDTYTYGVQWGVLPDLRLRGNRTISLRAPSVTELFTPTSSAFFFANDPCDQTFINQGPNAGAVRRQNCEAIFRALGVPLTGFSATIRTASQQGVTSGDPTLRNERGNSKTFGFVWEPSFLSGFNMQMDYIEIDITDSIGQLTATQVLEFCLDDPNFNRAAPLGPQSNPFCSRFNRTANGQVLASVAANGTVTPAVQTSFGNAAATDFRGITTTFGYNYEFENSTVLDLDVTAFNLRELSTLNQGVRDFADGELGNPERSYQVRAGVNHGALGASVQWNYQSSVVFDRNFTVETRDILRLSSYDTFDLGVNYNYDDNTTLRFSMTNVLDDKPPYGTTGIGVYDILGRRMTVSGEYRF
jgi:outer membrane cobalamin receptor